MNGQYCPQVEHALQTGAGDAVMRAGMRAGAWRRAGLSGVAVGLDLDHVVARAGRLAPMARPDQLEDLACALEAGAMSGMAIERAKDKPVSEQEPFDLDAFLDGSNPQ